MVPSTAAADRVPPRLFGLLVRETPVGVIIRRGPTKWCELVKWNTGSDAIERGQWLHARVYERRCDVTPDGTRMVYFAFDGQRQSETRGSYTAICKPPFWLPLALWPKGETVKGDKWCGGGLFPDNKTLFLNQKNEPLPGRGARGLVVAATHPYGSPGSECLGIYYPRLRRDGWQQTTVANESETPRVDVWVHAHPQAPYRLIKESVTQVNPTGHDSYSDRYAIETDAEGRVDLPDVEWADFDHRGRFVFARKGCLCAAQVEKGRLLDEKMIVDLNADTPRAVQPPDWARRCKHLSTKQPLIPIPPLHDFD